MDASWGVTQEVFSREKEFVKSIANDFNLSPDGPRGSASIYADDAYTVSSFVDNNFDERVDSATLLNRPRRIDRALDHAAQVLRSSNLNRRKIVILFTAGRQVQSSLPLSESIKRLKDLDVQTFVVNIGRRTDLRRVRPIVDRSEDIFLIPSSDQLPLFVRSISRKILTKPGNKNGLKTEYCLKLLKEFKNFENAKKLLL